MRYVKNIKHYNIIVNVNLDRCGQKQLLVSLVFRKIYRYLQQYRKYGVSEVMHVC